ncbi:MAG: arginine deiminase family protein [Anaerolineae bacterium]|nr:arginine deiminase family protein [Anaerolineae bacterium]
MTFTHALVRPPGDSFAAAISSTHAAIDVALAQAQHAEYCQALAAAGLLVEALPPDERFPDSCFMQDPAVVIGGRCATARRAVVGRPGAPSRQGEEDAVAAALTGRFPLTRLIPPATLEGGDVLILPDRVVVGQSGRTNAAGIAQLAVALSGTELPVYAAPVESYLHLLTAVTHIGQGILLAIEGWPLPAPLADLEVLRVPPEEAYAANSLGVGKYVIVPAGHPRTEAMLAARGLDILLVPMSEFAKADGGVTCLSLVW